MYVQYSQRQLRYPFINDSTIETSILCRELPIARAGCSTLRPSSGCPKGDVHHDRSMWYIMCPAFAQFPITPLAATGSSPLARIQQRPEALPPCLFKPDMKTSSKNEQIPAKPVCQLQFDPDKHDVNMKRSESCSTSQDATKQSATFIFSSPVCAGHSAPPNLVQQTARVLIKRWIFIHTPYHSMQ